jgi:NhaP-type Na+/H+ or K+/H+ antiporter
MWLISVIMIVMEKGKHMDVEAIYTTLGILSIIVFLYSVIAGKLASTLISGPMIFISIGWLLGNHGLDFIGKGATPTDLRFIVDVTLALVLFSDAAHSNLKVLKSHLLYPSRMLLLGLPGSIVLGFIAAVLIFDSLSLVEAAILGTMLAATDAALGKAVVTNPSVPAPVREGLNVESGLNDGMCVPILLILLTLASPTAEAVTISHGLFLLAEEIGIGLLVGLSFAFIGAKLLELSTAKKWLSEVWGQLSVMAIALSSFYVAQTFHGSGYIAAFSGGLLFGHLLSNRTHQLVLATEGIAELFAMLTWILFGATVIGTLFDHFSWHVVAYAIISLTVVRMVPTYLAFTGTRVSPKERLFMGWFGPRGLASLAFAVLVIDANVEHSGIISAVVSTTVLISLVSHGISAKPLSDKLNS